MQKGLVLIVLLPLLYLCFGSILIHCFYSVMAAKPEKMEIRRHLRDENGEGQASGPISDIEKDPEIRSRRWRHRNQNKEAPLHHHWQKKNITRKTSSKHASLFCTYVTNK
ncbi:hypothetical protein ABKV19_018974 [Rosa sericea]